VTDEKSQSAEAASENQASGLSASQTAPASESAVAKADAGVSDSVAGGTNASGAPTAQSVAPAVEEVLDTEFNEDDIVDELEVEEGDENASPIEELVEEVVEAPTDLPMSWYILKVQVNRENSICDALIKNIKRAGMERFFGEILVPTEDVREFTKSGKQRVVKKKLYPGYIVVRMAVNDDTWFLVRDTSGIGDFTGAAGKAVPLSQHEIDRILSSSLPKPADEGEETIKTAIKFKVGDRVRVKEGYFQNYEGELSNIDDRNGRITVMINIFGRTTTVELDHWQVEEV
jgi:transcriptional antiterminator NusG